MQNPIRVLRSQRGDLLIDSMVGAVIALIITGAAVSVLLAATFAAIGNATTTARLSLVNTVLSDSKPQIATFSAPQTVDRTVQGHTVPVTLWREDISPGVAVLHAAAPRKPDAPAGSCTNPAALDHSACLTAVTSTSSSRSGVAISTVPLTLVSGGVSFTAPAGATELRYLLKATDVPGTSSLLFTNQDHTEVSYSVPVPDGQTGYYYGRILVNAGAPLTLTMSGPAAYDTSSTMIYEAPE